MNITKGISICDDITKGISNCADITKGISNCNDILKYSTFIIKHERYYKTQHLEELDNLERSLIINPKTKEVEIEAYNGLKQGKCLIRCIFEVYSKSDQDSFMVLLNEYIMAKYIIPATDTSPPIFLICMLLQSKKDIEIIKNILVSNEIKAMQRPNKLMYTHLKMNYYSMKELEYFKFKIIKYSTDNFN